jgi:hypothetical protein
LTELVPTIEAQLAAASFAEPILIHSLSPMMGYGGFPQDGRFVAKYNKDCPKTRFNDLEAFSGILKLGGREIPAFRIFTQVPDLTDRVLLTELPRFARWQQYAPIESADDADYVSEFVYIRIVDLNVDDAKREALLQANPPWLENQPNKERYLRKRVVVNVYEKYQIEVIEPAAGAAFRVTVLQPEGN